MDFYLQEDDKAETDHQTRGTIDDQFNDEIPHQFTTAPFTTSPSDEEIKTRIATKLRSGSQAEASGNDHDYEDLLDTAIQEIQTEVCTTYTGEGIDQKAKMQVGFPAIQSYIHGSMQDLLINVDSEWTKAAATTSSHQTKVRLLEEARPLGNCAVLKHLGIR